MDLWIRSQDKLVMLKLDKIEIIDYKVKKEEMQKNIFLSTLNIEKFEKGGFEINSCGTFLGHYTTKERALEVLDEIQNALLNKWSNNVKYEEHYDNERPRSLVYEMPLE